MKTKVNCKYCNKEFEIYAFKLKVGKGKFCSKEHYQLYRKENKKDPKILNRLYQKKFRYGLSKEEYLNFFITQLNRCSICGKNFIKQSDAQVDHNHKTGKIRGLLCNRCNLVLGSFNDDISLFTKAIKYLTKK